MSGREGAVAYGIHERADKQIASVTRLPPRLIDRFEWMVQINIDSA